MSHETLVFLLILCIALLAAVICYQRIAFHTGIQRQLKQIHETLKRIADTDSDESVMIFTDNRELMELAAQINRLLEHSRKEKAGRRRFETASRKMLSNISHDIKTPMTVILGYLEIMRTSGGASPEMLAKAEEKAKSVMDLIDQFFTLAKSEAGDMDLPLSETDLCEICRACILDFYELLTKADFQVDINLPNHAVRIESNKDALRRILFNLISNVIRYGAAGKYIGLSLRAEESCVSVDIIDKGQGIDKAFAETVFDRLFTMEDSRNRSIQGNGLGLTIARNLARQLGGDILLESTPYVKTVFTLRLPLFPGLADSSSGQDAPKRQPYEKEAP